MFHKLGKSYSVKVRNMPKKPANLIFTSQTQGEGIKVQEQEIKRVINYEEEQPKWLEENPVPVREGVTAV